VIGEQNLSTIAANQLSGKLLGKTIYANVLMLGFAWQHGLVPVSLKALLRAIELNGVDIDLNKQAFGWGRLAAVDLNFVFGYTAGPVVATMPVETLDQMIRRRAEFLVEYQDKALSDRFLELIATTRSAEESIVTSGATPLTEAVTRAYFKTLAYKDEYEVARLHTDTGFLEKLRDDYGDSVKIRFHLAPPLLPSESDARGRPRKREFGQWMIPMFKILARLKRLRGTPFDIFGLLAERKMERALISEFEGTVERLLGGLSASNIDDAASIARLYLEIRGYGPVKEAAALEVRANIESRLANYLNVTEIAA
jgi:indolepyruvate ferredoxin oxidoreductase